MKFREIFRFELAYQVRRVATWLFFAVLVVFAFLLIRAVFISDARSGVHLLNAPLVIAGITVFGGVIWLLLAAAVAGEAAARDVETGMDPLTYTAPVSKADYLGGRFLAAFVLNALILLGLPVGILLALLTPGLEPDLLGPFRPAAYLTAYFFIALPLAFVATAIQFSCAALGRRGVASYLASGFLFFTSHFISGAVANLLGRWELTKLLDVIGIIGSVAGELNTWTPLERNTRLISMEGWLLANRLLWLGGALGTLAFTYFRFQFEHPFDSLRSLRASHRIRLSRRPKAIADTAITADTKIAMPGVQKTFGFATYARQTLAIAWDSFRMIARSRGGLTFVIVVAIPMVVLGRGFMRVMGVPVLPTTAQVLHLLTAPLSDLQTPWIVIPLLIVYYAGELVWRERDAGLNEIADAAPVSEWVFLLGKLLGLGLVLAMWMALLMTVGMLIQLTGPGGAYPHLEIGLYLRTLFGLQLTEYFLFASLVFVAHVLVNQKYVGHLVALVGYGFLVFASRLGIEHHLLVYGSAPGWSYTDMRGFGPSLVPWLWFKFYWAAWALLFAVAARLLWARGRDQGFRTRLRLARARVTPPTARAATIAGALVLAVGGFIFYNTNVLNAHHTAADRTNRSVQYERRYRKHAGIPQPNLAGSRVHVEIYPRRREVEIRGTYSLVNRHAVAIDSIHVATVPGVETGEMTFDRPAARVFADDDLGHRIYEVKNALQPGESLRLSFEVRFKPRGFPNDGIDDSVVANGTYFTNREWLPAIGYQRNRELVDAGARTRHGLAPRPTLPSLYDAEAQLRGQGADRVAFEAVVGTDADQTAVAPGLLRRAWMDPSTGSGQAGRRYFHYSTDAPIRNEYAFSSADYAVHEARWNPSTRSARSPLDFARGDPEPLEGSGQALATGSGQASGQSVTIKIFHHPGHASNLDRMVRSVRASLDYYVEQFGPYPYGHLTLVERGGGGDALSAEASAIDYGEKHSLLNPKDGRDLDVVFFGVAHEVAHQWWGHGLVAANVEGIVLLAEGLANYSAMQVLEKTYGHEHLDRYLSQVLRAAYEVPRTRAAVPLLRADTAFLGYRKGAQAMYALRRYIGEERVNGALRQLFEKHSSGAPPLPTTLDLYRELQAVTPDSLHSLLHDLFEANTFWELETEQAAAVQTGAGTWQVTLDVQARKVVVDEAGGETEVPMDDWIEVGVFADAGEPYLQKHRIRAGKQTITVMVPRKPARAGIDPRYLLIDLDTDDNIKVVR